VLVNIKNEKVAGWCIGMLSWFYRYATYTRCVEYSYAFYCRYYTVLLCRGLYDFYGVEGHLLWISI